MTDEERIRETARKAIDILLKGGWCNDGPIGPNGERCLAMATVAASMEYDSHVDRRVASLLGLDWRNADLASLIGGWNDEPGRTIDEVLSVLERVANGEGA